MSRPPKLTPAIQKAIVQAVAAGVSFPKACDLGGISPDSGKEWIQRGEGREPNRPATEPYVSFAQAVKKAKAADERRRVQRITKAAMGRDIIAEKTTTFPDGRKVREVRYNPAQWTADAWYLERSDPDTWGRRERVDVRLLIQQTAAKIAEEFGMTAEDVLAEAESYLHEGPHAS